MLLRKMTLKDFRQFKGSQEISFSQDENQNVTIIVGENGTGKTTFSQAFNWCLYGTEKLVFSDKNLLCKSTAQEMNPNDECTVSVCLKFNHNDTEYTCKREQTYYKDPVGNIKSKQNTRLVLEYKDKKDGQQKKVQENLLESEVNKILPKDLSHYFFFDGERITVMSKEIASGKSKEFADAVKSLLGLSGFENALNHLNGQHNLNSVVRSYRKELSANGNSDFEKLNSEITTLEETKEGLCARLTGIESELGNATVQKQKLQDELKKYSSIENDIALRSSYQERLKNAEERKNGKLSTNGKIEQFGLVTDFLKSFSDGNYNFFVRKLINDVLEKLDKSDIKDTGIPDIHERTINYLINVRHQCICGTPIVEGSEIHKHLIDLLQFIPPQSLGTSIRNFVDVAKEKVKTEGFCEALETKYSMIRSCSEEIKELNDKISELNKNIANSSESEIQQKQHQFEQWEQKEKDLIEERGQKSEQVKNLENEINGKNQSLSTFANISENNKKISLYKMYAEYIYNSLKADYENEEKKVRIEFEKTINEIFKKIYNGGLSLKIDEKYNIKIIVNDFNGYSEDVETSTAQSLSVILAFISSVIKMARENQNSGNKLLVTESYPLVMDAPLSAFDKTRIQTICEVLPKTAEQVIIFINDKDGEIAEANMNDKIGKKYRFSKKNEFETYMEEA